MLRATVVGLFVFVPRIYACGCVGQMTQCDRNWSLGETIFLGKTVAMEKLPHPEVDASYAAHFSIEEGFRGTSGSEIVVYTGAGGGDCGYPFEPGTSYVVYATRDAGNRLHASICSQTRPAVMMAGALRELRATRDHTRLDDIFGTIGMAPRISGYEDLTESQPLPKVTVRATSSAGKTVSVETDDHGAYAFSSLPAGIYSIDPDLPPGFARSQPFTVDNSAGGCRVDHFARSDGRVEGTVVDGSGTPVAGFVTIELYDPSQRRGGLPGTDVGPDGKFNLPIVPPGRYRLVFHPKVGNRVEFRTTFYWPPKTADPFDLSFGQHLDAVEFKVFR